MSQQDDNVKEMPTWSRDRFHRWITALSEDRAPREVNFWLWARWPPQMRAYDRTLSADTRREWAEVMLSLTDGAERFAGFDRWTAAADKFNLRSLLIGELGSVPGDRTWDVSALLRDALAMVTLTPDQARELAEHWQTLPREQIFLLSDHKVVLTPLVSLTDHLDAGSEAELVRAWLAVLPAMP